MKAVQLKQEQLRSTDILLDALTSCLQILVGNEEWAIACQLIPEPTPAQQCSDMGLGICEHLKRYKEASLENTFKWAPTESINLIPRKDCEQSKLEEGRETRDLEQYEWGATRLHKILTSAVKSRGLKFVEQQSTEKLDKVCNNFYSCWQFFLKTLNPDYAPLMRTMRRLTCSSDERPYSDIFIDYHLLFLRKKIAN
eukprot:Gregarina_sp_Poly_1__8594@NODE_50_length_17596_cov_118_903303_g43_i0_p8_GENE_NODE_50_length_17596_cov_118_903303_g43_i0NODE_50_length_17596_cov_118_903303_g43_i0_p8_ORF_typecomplete_len197_score17_12UME/PF08064_13/0_14_NODE_50_length_17596_cov_118_903303_g43_i04551045